MENTPKGSRTEINGRSGRLQKNTIKNVGHRERKTSGNLLDSEIFEVQPV